MTERGRPALRRIHVLRTLAVGALLTLALTGCGNAGDDVQGAPAGGATTAPTTATTCAPAELQGDDPAAQADLDGDGTPDEVYEVAAHDACPAALVAHVDGKESATAVDGDLPITEYAVVRIPGRTGEVLLSTQSSPRGGAQPRLFGYADTTFAELTTAGDPLFGFVATDAPTEHVSAACTPDGFTITRAVAHQPAGVVPAWDVQRTSYTVDGNEVTAGATTEVADNVLDSQLAGKYPALVKGSLFESCRARVN